jgi:hypothetical protein
MTLRSRSLLVLQILAIGSLLAVSYDAMRPPEFYVQSDPVTAPSESRFTLRNPSFLFAMRRTVLGCALVKVELKNGTAYGNESITDPDVATIAPRGARHYSCPLDQMIGARAGVRAKERISNIASADVAIVARYETIGIRRSAESPRFRWDDVSRRWTPALKAN